MPIFMGDDFTARDEKGELKVRIATVFPHADTIVTWPYTHFEQRFAYIESLNHARVEQGKPPLTDAEQDAEMEVSVDLLVDEQAIVIRPDPSRMDLAFDADELLQETPPKRPVKFLFLSDRRVRESLKRRGECWRIFQPPTDPHQIRKMIVEARSGIDGRPIYYYSPSTGTRLLTFQNLRQLGDLNDAELRQHLLEIAIYSSRRNRRRHREIEYFMSREELKTSDFEELAHCSDEMLRPKFSALCGRCRQAIAPEFLRDDLDDATWRKAMFGLLIAQPDDAPVDDQTMGLDPDFSMRVEWLPGGRIEQGELILDRAMEETDAKRQEQISTVIRGLILNLVQEYGDLEYINLGSVLPSPNRNPQRGGRREVYVAQIKQRRAIGEVLQIIRMQRWGVRERLDQGKTLEDAMLETEEYAEYVFDRRLACQQLGMNLPHRQTTRKVSETYHGGNWRYSDRRIWTPYFQRDYITGVGTDQLPARKLADDAYAMIFSRLLGQAAASNIILGRAELPPPPVRGPIVFDVGDEILAEDDTGMPLEIVVSDHVGTFVDWEGTLDSRAPEYAGPISRRLAAVNHREEFIEAYLSGFVERFVRVQEEYAKHRRAFNTLFKHRPFDCRGSLACRWSFVLDRLGSAKPRVLSDLIRSAISPQK